MCDGDFEPSFINSPNFMLVGIWQQVWVWLVHNGGTLILGGLQVQQDEWARYLPLGLLWRLAAMTHYTEAPFWDWEFLNQGAVYI